MGPKIRKKKNRQRMKAPRTDQRRSRVRTVLRWEIHSQPSCVPSSSPARQPSSAPVGRDRVSRKADFQPRRRCAAQSRQRQAAQRTERPEQRRLSSGPASPHRLQGTVGEAQRQEHTANDARQRNPVWPGVDRDLEANSRPRATMKNAPGNWLVQRQTTFAVLTRSSMSKAWPGRPLFANQPAPGPWRVAPAYPKAASPSPPAPSLSLRATKDPAA